MNLALQTYTIRDFTQDEASIYESLKKIKAIGYNAFQLSCISAIKTERLKQIVDELGLTICATDNSLADIVENTDSLIAKHKILGVKYVGLGWFMAKNFAELKQFIKDITPAVKKLADNGLKFLYHNHAAEFVKFDGIRMYDYILQNTKPNEVGLLPDTFWLQRAGLNPIKFIKDNADRIDMIHYKDMRISNTNFEPEFSEIYEGNIDFDAITDACLDAKIKWAIVEQDSSHINPFDSISISLNNIKKHCLNKIEL